ncbi:MAG: homoserine dehydrogenase [Candidatus Omnitrophica bacterium]|nr:homoserine dehydrogenase [Candidatus Omnitrophota bacterium]
MRNINVGIIGYGTVGCGVARALKEKRAYLSRRLGASINLVKVCDKDLKSRRPFRIDRRLLTKRPAEVINNPEIDIVVELIGGISPAREFILQAIKNKKHVITANKALLSEEKRRLFKAAQANGVELRFEASVGGGIPIIKALREGLVANRIMSIYAIINGTCNYILSEMTQKRIGFNAALEQAKKKGYAERNPALDIEGHDSAHKLAIMASMAYGIDVRPKDIYVEGISNISDDDIRYARGFGYVVKLLAIAKRIGRVLELRVHPTLVNRNHPLASVGSNFNAVFLDSDMLGEALFYGQGSGSAPSASAVVSDIVDVARNIINNAETKMPSIVYDKQADRIKRQKDFYTSYYIRFSAIDKPGVLSKISKILAQHKISIASVSQKVRRRERIVPIIMMTHDAKESALSNALKKIDGLDIIRRKSVVIRSEKDLE